jgi:hypothetical protein
MLDVAFGEDDCRVRVGNAAENLSRVRRIALMLLQRDKSCKLGVKSKRKKAGWNRDYLLTVLGIVQMRLPWSFQCQVLTCPLHRLSY